MDEGRYSEAQAAAQLGVSERTLRRWRAAGLVPFCKTPGGRIFYSFAQVVEIGAAMMVAAASPLAESGQTCPDMSGEMLDAAE